MTLTDEPLYVSLAQMPPGQYKPLGGGPASGGALLPRKQEPVDARSLGYADPRVTIDMHVSRREGDPGQPVRGPAEQPHREEA